MDCFPGVSVAQELISNNIWWLQRQEPSPSPAVLSLTTDGARISTVNL